MRLKLLIFSLGLMVMSLSAQIARAGAIRYAGKEIAKGTSGIAATAATGGEAVAGGVATVGKVTGGAVKTGGTATVRGMEATPGVVAHGTKTVAKKIWKAVW